MLQQIQKSYLAGFLDGDGSIYVRAKPNDSYTYGFQIAPCIAFFQSSKDREKFEKICALLPYGRMRIRKDGICEYTISRQSEIREVLKLLSPFLILKKKQSILLLKILDQKKLVKNAKDFQALLDLVDMFRELNYSKKRKKRTLTP